MVDGENKDQQGAANKDAMWFDGDTDKSRDSLVPVKQGKLDSSSEMLGKAEEILPVQFLEAENDQNEPSLLNPNDSILKESTHPGILDEALEKVKKLFRKGNEKFLGGRTADGREIVGELFDGDKKLFVFSDQSIEDESTVRKEKLTFADDLPNQDMADQSTFPGSV